MKKLSHTLSNYISQEVTTLANCWKIILKSGKILGFTDCDIDIEFQGVVYKAESGFTASSIISTIGLSVDNLEVTAQIGNDEIKEEDILNGLYDNCEIEIFTLNYMNPSQGCISLNKGYLGEITITQGKFVAEIKSITTKLDKLIGEIYSPICRAKFGDNRCKINKKSLAEKGIITKINSSYSFMDNTRREERGYFNFGVIKFVSGEMSGYEIEVKDFIDKEFFVALPMPQSIKNGDQYIVIPGCDGSFSSCKTKYSNSLNFRGEPHIPGKKYMYTTSSTK